MANPVARRWLGFLALAVLATSAQAASPVHKCIVDGTVTFQNTPCAGDKLSRQPTVDELNSARKKRLAEAAALAASAPAPSSVDGSARPPDPMLVPTPPREQAARCDGRTHCSQMRSCSEAKFFLANCPGVKMDGNRDGTPCERQWCTHPFAK